ncbi:MAG: cupredoxin domain-containing protein [Patescibacteria group bacterium]
MKKRLKIFGVSLAIVAILVALIVIIVNFQKSPGLNIKPEIKKNDTTPRTTNWSTTTPLGSLSKPKAPLPAPPQDVVTPEQITVEAIDLEIADGSFSPLEFTVKSGTEAKLALTGTGESMHLLSFMIPDLASSSVTVVPDETRLFTLKVPSKPGTYDFIVDSATTIGKIIVK